MNQEDEQVKANVEFTRAEAEKSRAHARLMHARLMNAQAEQLEISNKKK